MIPNIFVSSTIQDLHHLRGSIREVILSLGYNPIMSDYGDIGYLPTSSVEDSCYITMRECDLAILIIGKRYGAKSVNDLSVTHNEMKAARKQNIPIISVIDKEVLSFKQVFDANDSDSTTVFPGMDYPKETFTFIRDIMSSELNNGILSFSTSGEAAKYLKKQLAHIFGDLLKKRYDPARIQMTDILSEVQTLRHELLKDKGNEPARYLRATKFLLNEKKWQNEYKKIVEMLLGGIDQAIPLMLKSNTFDDFLENAGATFTKIESEDKPDIESLNDKLIFMAGAVAGPNNVPLNDQEVASWGILIDKEVIMNDVAKQIFNHTHENFRKETT